MVVIKNSYFQKSSDKPAFIYYEGTPTFQKLYNPLFKAIVSLANTTGGQVLISKRIPGIGEGKTKYRLIPKSQLDACLSAVADILGTIGNNLPFNPVAYWGRDLVDQEKQLYRISINVNNYTDGLLPFVDSAGRKTNYYRDSNGNILPVLTQCKPKDIEIKIIKNKIRGGRKQTSGDNEYELINFDEPIKHAYKYMTMDVFLTCLKYGTLRMQEPTNWSDQYEGRFYKAKYDDITSDPLPKLYATCITANPASEAAWKVYAHGTGLGARCVQIKLNMEKLREQLCNGKNGDYYEGKVFYDLTDAEIDNLHLKGTPYHSLFFSEFNSSKFVRLMLIKRQAYQYENETRLFLINPPIKPGKSQNHYYDAPVKWKDIIEEIRIEHTCTSTERFVLEMLCKEKGIEVKMPSKKGPKARNEIPIIEVNIDRMTGKKRIKIQNV